LPGSSIGRPKALFAGRRSLIARRHPDKRGQSGFGAWALHREAVREGAVLVKGHDSRPTKNPAFSLMRQAAAEIELCGSDGAGFSGATGTDGLLRGLGLLMDGPLVRSLARPQGADRGARLHLARLTEDALKIRVRQLTKAGNQIIRQKYRAAR